MYVYIYIYDNHRNVRPIHFSADGKLKDVFEATIWQLLSPSFTLTSYNISKLSLLSAKLEIKNKQQDSHTECAIMINKQTKYKNCMHTGQKELE